MTTTAKFEQSPTSPAAARRFVTEVLGHFPPLIGERAALMVSELATNAVQHAHTGFSVSVDQTADSIRVEVSDTGPGRPVIGAPTPKHPSGRGLLIVKAISDAFGIETSQSRKVVWFAISTVSEGGRLQPSQSAE